MDQQSLPDRDTRWIRVVLWIVWPVVVLSCWVGFAFVVSRFAGPAEDASPGLLGVIGLLIGFIAVAWLGTRLAWICVRWMVSTTCPACDGRVRLRRVRRTGGVASYILLRCTSCGETYENFNSWHWSSH